MPTPLILAVNICSEYVRLCSSVEAVIVLNSFLNFVKNESRVLVNERIHISSIKFFNI